MAFAGGTMKYWFSTCRYIPRHRKMPTVSRASSLLNISAKNRNTDHQSVKLTLSCWRPQHDIPRLRTVLCPLGSAQPEPLHGQSMAEGANESANRKCDTAGSASEARKYSCSSAHGVSKVIPQDGPSCLWLVVVKDGGLERR